MALSYFCDKNQIPSENEVSEILDNAVVMWNDVEQYIEKYGLIKEEWKFYSQKISWCKKIFLISKKGRKKYHFFIS